MDTKHNTSAPPQRHPGGRPKVWTDERRAEVIETILDELPNGVSLTDILQPSDMPSYTTVLKWLDEDPEFARKYARAREAAADMFEARVIEAGQKALDGKLDGASATAAQNAYKWAAAKRKPKVYGDRVDVDVRVSEERPGWVIDLTPAKTEVLAADEDQAPAALPAPSDIPDLV